MSQEENVITYRAVKHPGRGEERARHSATCSVCGNEALVPFVPSPDKPVYCDSCFKTKREASKAKRQRAKRPVVEPVVVQQKEIIPTDTSAFGKFGLDERLLRGVAEAGYEEPTEIQQKSIPMIMTGRDFIGTAQTGTGKTAAFVLPILHKLLQDRSSKGTTKVLVLSPTRELAEQTYDCIRQLGKHTRISATTVYGGVGMDPQEKALRRGVDIVVACPGRLLDHMGRGSAKLNDLTMLVLDEADRMLDMGFMPDVKRILKQLPKHRQTMLLSATIPPELAELTQVLNDADRVDIGIKAPAKTVDHALYICPAHLKEGLLLSMLDSPDLSSVLIFARTRHRADRLARKLEKAGHSVVAMHSDKTQGQRQKALGDFKSGKFQIMVATDIAARGLDIADVSHVINYDIPDTADTYIHRIGRTGRAEKEGDAMTIVTSEDMGVVADIEKALGQRIERRAIDRFDYNVAPPQIKEFEKVLQAKAKGPRSRGPRPGGNRRRSSR